MAYVDWNTGESQPVTNPQGVREHASLRLAGRCVVEIELFDAPFALPLFERAEQLCPGEMQALEPCNVVSYGGWTVCAAAVRAFMDEDGFNRSALGLQRDARLFVGTDSQWRDELGNRAFPVAGRGWRVNPAWLGKGRPNPYGYHVGTDINARRGVEAVSVSDGTVVAMRRADRQAAEDLWGNMVAVADETGHVFNYCHMDEFPAGVEPGQAVRKGQALGPVGRSGYETAPYETHLHFEVYACRSSEPQFGYDMTDGKRRVPATAVGRTVAVNPLPYLAAWWKAQQESGI